MTEYRMVFEDQGGVVVCPGPGWTAAVLSVPGMKDRVVYYREMPAGPDPEPVLPRAEVAAALQRCYDRDDSVVAEMIAEWLGIELRE